MPQRMSIAPENTANPHPVYSPEPLEKVRPRSENPLKRSQNPKTNGNVRAERAGVKVR